MLRRAVLLLTLPALLAAGDFTVYLGDSHSYYPSAVTTDAAGNTYVTGSRVTGANTSDVFVTKLSTAGDILFTATFGGKSSDQAAAIAVDVAGNIWVGGSTTSDNFPLHHALQTNFGVSTTGFLVKLAADGTVLYSSYYGGTLYTSSVTGVATDQSGNVYVSGTTSSSDFPVTAGMPTGVVRPPSAGGGSAGAFVSKLDPSGATVLYSGLIAGTHPVCSGGSSCFLMSHITTGTGIAVDSAGNAYLAGNTNTDDLPVTPGAFFAAGYGAFAAKIKADGSGLAYLTYLGQYAGIVSLSPSEGINVSAIAVDASGNAYLTGNTNDRVFPATAGAFQPALGGLSGGTNRADAFVAKLNPNGTALAWATYVGGINNDQAASLAVDAAGNVWVGGSTQGSFPGTMSALDGQSNNAAGGFLAELKNDGSALLSSTLLPVQSVAALDANGVLHLAGQYGLVSTMTPQQALTPRILGITNAASGPFTGRVSPGEVIAIYGPGIGPAAAVTGAPDGNGLYPKTLGGVQVTINGVAAPLLYVSATQINVQTPFLLGDLHTARVAITNGSAALPVFRASVDAAIPGIFMSGGFAAAINQDGKLNSQTNPAKAGSVVSVWATGTGNTFGVDGQVATAAANQCSCMVTVNGETQAGGFSLVQYAGAAPGLIDGVSQINFTVPPVTGAGVGLSVVTLSVGTANSPAATVFVSP